MLHMTNNLLCCISWNTETRSAGSTLISLLAPVTESTQEQTGPTGPSVGAGRPRTRHRGTTGDFVPINSASPESRSEMLWTRSTKMMNHQSLIDDLHWSISNQLNVLFWLNTGKSIVGQHRPRVAVNPHYKNNSCSFSTYVLKIPQVVRNSMKVHILSQLLQHTFMKVEYLQ